MIKLLGQWEYLQLSLVSLLEQILSLCRYIIEESITNDGFNKPLELTSPFPDQVKMYKLNYLMLLGLQSLITTKIPGSIMETSGML